MALLPRHTEMNGPGWRPRRRRVAGHTFPATHWIGGSASTAPVRSSTPTTTPPDRVWSSACSARRCPQTPPSAARSATTWPCSCVLRHQHLLSVIAFDDRHVAIVYEWVDAITLRHLIDVSGRLIANAALVVFDDTLAALEALHAAGVIHRDVTPERGPARHRRDRHPARRRRTCPTAPSRLASGDPAVHGA